MIIKAEKVYKRYTGSWILKDFSYIFQNNQMYAVIGANGSGKSTLLNIISGQQNLSKGEISWKKNGKNIPKDRIYEETCICSPAMELVEEMSLKEFLDFHFTFKELHYLSSKDELIELLEMGKQKHQKIMEFSSGMKQRVKLAQAFFSKSALLLLDEPTSYLDLYWVEKYQKWMELYTKDRICIVASNDIREYKMTQEQIQL